MFPRPVLCWLNLFASCWNLKKPGENSLGHARNAAPPADVPRQVGLGTWQHFNHLSSSPPAGLRAAPWGQGGQGCTDASLASGPSSWNLTKTRSWKDTCFFHSLRFSQSPNYNFRIQQRSRTLRSFPQKFQVHQKAVVQTRWHGKKHHQSSP